MIMISKILIIIGISFAYIFVGSIVYTVNNIIGLDLDNDISFLYVLAWPVLLVCDVFYLIFTLGNKFVHGIQFITVLLIYSIKAALSTKPPEEAWADYDNLQNDKPNTNKEAPFVVGSMQITSEEMAQYCDRVTARRLMCHGCIYYDIKHELTNPCELSLSPEICERCIRIRAREKECKEEKQ